MRSRRKNGFNRKISLFIVGLLLISMVPGYVLAEDINADNNIIVQLENSAAKNNLNEFKTTEQLDLETSILPDSEVLATLDEEPVLKIDIRALVNELKM